MEEPDSQEKQMPASQSLVFLLHSLYTYLLEFIYRERNMQSYIKALDQGTTSRRRFGVTMEEEVRKRLVRGWKRAVRCALVWAYEEG